MYKGVSEADKNTISASSQEAFGGRMDKHAVHDVLRNLSGILAVHDLEEHASIHGRLLRRGGCCLPGWEHEGTEYMV